MNDTTVRGSALYANRAWFLGGTNRRVSARETYKILTRPCRAAVCREALKNVQSAKQDRDSQHKYQQATHAQPAIESHPDFGYTRELHTRYDIGEQLGSGGYASVYTAKQKQTCQVFACKSIAKSVEKGASPAKAAEHVEAIKREILVLKRLRGSLNVASLVEVQEDDTHVHLLLEHCEGGELVHRIGDRHYSERTVHSRLCFWRKASLSDGLGVDTVNVLAGGQLHESCPSYPVSMPLKQNFA